MSMNRPPELKWISTQLLWDEAIAALLLLDLPMALLDDPGSEHRYTITKPVDDHRDISIEHEKKNGRRDSRDGCMWELLDSTGFSGDRDNDYGFSGSDLSSRALLSLALHAASANCTDDDGKPHTLDGVDLSAPVGFSWIPDDVRVPGARSRFVLALNNGDIVASAWHGQHGWRWKEWAGSAGGGSDSLREAMDAAQLVVTMAHDLDMSCSLDGCEWTWYPDASRLELSRDGIMVATVRGSRGGWHALVVDRLPGCQMTSPRDAMTDAEAMLENAGRARRSAPAPAPRCPVHECANGERACGRDAYDFVACAKTVQETVLPREKPSIEVVDARPAEDHIDRLNRCLTMLPKISEETLVDVFAHLCAIVEVEAGE